MAYKLIKGKFHLFYESEKKRHVGSQPDGDSIWFKPDNPKFLKKIGGRDAKTNKGGFTQLRFEAIDALETHFKGKHQHITHALEARDFTLSELSFNNVQFSGNKKLSVKTAIPHPTDGYILTRSIDPYGRPVSFVFKGKPNHRDGNEVYLDVKLLNKSVNALLAKSGNAFPSFYTGLPTDLRNKVVQLVKSSKRKKMWKDDKSQKGVKIRDLDDLQKVVIFPKLCRRIVSFFNNKKKDIGTFEKWLRADKERDDKLWILSRGDFANMHDIIAIKGKTISMKYAPEDIIVVPR